MCKVQITRNGSTPFQFKINTEETDLNDNIDGINFGTTIEVTGEIVDGGDLLNVKAVINYRKSFVCDRCLAQSVADEVVEIDEELDRTDIADDFVDLTEMIRDTLLASQSIQNICREDCKGLCPVCGVNLNESTCNCDRFIVDPRLEVLKKFLPQESKSH